MIRLQILIVAYGRKGIERIASTPHPHVEGVEYIVSWQYGDDEINLPESLICRSDFKIIPTDTRGVARNRNLALQAASAPIVLLSDDDVYYTAEQIREVLRTYDEYPDADFISFAYTSENNPIYRPSEVFDLSRPAKGWSVGGAFEMSFRLDPVRRNGIRFNELFGIGHEFPSGEEECLIHDIIKCGLKAIYVPKVIVTHPDTTTSMREGNSDTFIRTKGALFAILYPRTWFLRMITHTLRLKSGVKARMRYMRAWIKGYRDYHRIIKNQNKG